jgi:hypothetical protein
MIDEQDIIAALTQSLVPPNPDLVDWDTLPPTWDALDPAWDGLSAVGDGPWLRQVGHVTDLYVHDNISKQIPGAFVGLGPAQAIQTRKETVLEQQQIRVVLAIPYLSGSVAAQTQGYIKKIILATINLWPDSINKPLEYVGRDEPQFDVGNVKIELTFTAQYRISP